MDSKKINEKKNNYLIPTVVVAVLLVISLSLLLIFFFGSGDDTSVSKGNVVGSPNSEMARTGGGTRLALTKAPGFLRYLQSTLKYEKQDKLTLAWWTGNDAEKSFTVSNLMPGDVEVKEYKLKINSSHPNHIFFDIVIENPSVLTEALLLKVEVGEDLLYDGPFDSEIGQLDYNISRAQTDEFTYKITVSLPTSAGNRYAGKSLDADFVWSFDETVVFPSNPSSGTRPIIATSFDSISAVGQKTVEGDTPETAETFSFLLEFKNMLGKYEPVGTVSCDGEGKIDFTDLMSSFSFERIGLYEFRITEVAGTTDGEKTSFSLSPNKKYTINITSSGTAKKCYARLFIGGNKFITDDFFVPSTISFAITLSGDAVTTLEVLPGFGIASDPTCDFVDGGEYTSDMLGLAVAIAESEEEEESEPETEFETETKAETETESETETEAETQIETEEPVTEPETETEAPVTEDVTDLVTEAVTEPVPEIE